MADGVVIGLENIHYAILTKDDATGLTYGVPKRIPGAIEAKVSPKSDTAKLYSDNKLSKTANSMGEIEVEINVEDLPLTVRAELLGKTIANGVLQDSSDDVAPEIALGYITPKSNGKNRYVWLLKGQFSEPEDDAKTKEDKTTFQTATVKGTFMPRNFDKHWRFTGDEDETGFTAGATWFDAVYEPPADAPAAP